MKRLTLLRDYKKEATTGALIASTGKKICCTLERPNLSNARDNPNTPENESSCIPEGFYKVKRYSSPKFSNTWEIVGVSGRSKILFHTANFITELLGCVATCEQVIDMNPQEGDRVPAEKRWIASQSKMGFKKLQDYIGDQDFELTVTSVQTQCQYRPEAAHA
jgi:hypothetical protein